ncbi:hypothetical protein [Enterobacter roggenkampii]|uniref:hypothetical protein n=1 Tax=Enterobacter roggenkampii TaxID=1812935 RepID=UPI00207C7326|nr:hypothetical protein [Enterobacter roggenkampii]MCO4144136.1 hypothetical protein [Enterobacter roggenkampii]
MAVRPGNFQQNDTLNRYLLFFPRNANALNDVHSFTGEEALSQPYRYTIRFTSPKALLNKSDFG